MQQDRVVAEGKERERRATLERVNKMIFHETDSAKGFHSAALHCDVLAERSAQIEFKQQVGCFFLSTFTSGSSSRVNANGVEVIRKLCSFTGPHLY